VDLARGLAASIGHAVDLQRRIDLDAELVEVLGVLEMLSR
jgi:hypothetical protein